MYHAVRVFKCDVAGVVVVAVQRSRGDALELEVLTELGVGKDARDGSSVGVVAGVCCVVAAGAVRWVDSELVGVGAGCLWRAEDVVVSRVVVGFLELLDNNM